MATSTASRNVRYNERIGAWEIVRAGETLASAVADTKHDALEQARAMVRREGGGEVRVRGSLDRILEAEKVRAFPWSRRVAA